MKRIDPAKTVRFCLAALGVFAMLAAMSYVCFPIWGVLTRSSDSVASTEWVSWNLGSLTFEEETVTHKTAESTYTLPYEERDGAVRITQSGKDYMVLARFGSNKLITSDGAAVFYLKTASASTADWSEEPRGGSADEAD